MDFRTDLAVESKEIYEESQRREGKKAAEIKGAEVQTKSYGDDVKATDIRIVDEEGERILGKPKGRYVTIEVDSLIDGSEELKEHGSEALAKELAEFVPYRKGQRILVAGLGNLSVTPDSLGPRTLQRLDVTCHLFDIFQCSVDEELSCVSAVVPGVTATTGMETAGILKSIAGYIHPETVIVVDSLAARDMKRISTTIQINDTGISPGGGMGNHRLEINEKTLGCRVVCVGVPTVIDSRTLIIDALRDRNISDEDIQKYISKKGHDMIVTATDIDQIVRDFSEIISNGINITLHPGIYS